jgi:hypothetical protein
MDPVEATVQALVKYYFHEFHLPLMKMQAKSLATPMLAGRKAVLQYPHVPELLISRVVRRERSSTW